MLETELVDSDGEHYVIEGLGLPPASAGLGENFAARHRLKIRKSDFALIELIHWDYPIITLNELGEITDRDDKERYKAIAYMRSVVEFSRYGEDFAIPAPTESDIVVELFTTWPRDNDKNLSVNAEFGFHLSEAVPVMLLEIDPPTRLVSTTDAGGYKAFTAESSFDPDTTYTVTLNWGDSESALETITWSFSTR
ncbi:MAG: Ig-like domain-containing protein [Dehalococcoidia bacterium]|jgi:hypothetical protein|nr:Ig-like domain-containing protein [Dehalococcoidia bacterium]